MKLNTVNALVAVWNFITWNIQWEFITAHNSRKALHQITEWNQSCVDNADYSNAKQAHHLILWLLLSTEIQWNTQHLIGSAEVCVSPVVDWQPAQDEPHLSPSVRWETLHKQMAGRMLRSSPLRFLSSPQKFYNFIYAIR